MAKVKDLEQKTLMSELKQGKQLAKQLLNHLQPSSSPQTSSILIQKIICSYENAISVLNNSFHLEEEEEEEEAKSNTALKVKTETSEHYIKDKGVFKKRKRMAERSVQVKICSQSQAGLEGPNGDGFHWRKYGQKDILGAKFPRGYFRCSHRFSQGCLATKQVQKSDEDPLIFEITYYGRHSCNQNQNQNQNPQSSSTISFTDYYQQSRPTNQSITNTAIDDDNRHYIKKQSSQSQSHSHSHSHQQFEEEKLPLLLLEDDEDLSFGFLSPSSTGRSEISFPGSAQVHHSSPAFGENTTIPEIDEKYFTESVANNVPFGDLEEHYTFDNLLEFFCW